MRTQTPRPKADPHRAHCDALRAANERMDEFQAAVRHFYTAIFDDVGDDRDAFLAAVAAAQVALRNESPRGRVNDNPTRAGEWFDRIRAERKRKT